MHKVSFKIQNVSMVGMGEESFTAGSVYTRDLEDDVYGRLSSLKDNGFVVFISDIKVEAEGTVAPVKAPKVVEAPPVIEAPKVEEEIAVPPGVEEVIIESVDAPKHKKGAKKDA